MGGTREGADDMLEENCFGCLRVESGARGTGPHTLHKLELGDQNNGYILGWQL